MKSFPPPRAGSGTPGLLLTGFLLLFLAAGCRTPETPTSAAQLLRVGVAPISPPLVFKQDRALAGLEIDLARALGEEMGRPVQFVERRWEDLIESLIAGKVDIVMSGMTVTPERAVRVRFTRPYLRSGQLALVRRDQLDTLRVMLFRAEYRFGVQRGTTGDYFVQHTVPRAERLAYQTARDGARALLHNKIDAFIHDAPVNWWLASENERAGLAVIPTYLTEEYLAWAVRKEDDALFEAANRFLERKQESGELLAITGRWVPFR